MRAAIITPDACIELLPEEDANAEDIDFEGPRLVTRAHSSIKLLWSYTAASLTANPSHNQLASKLAGQSIYGDCIVQLPLPPNTGDQVALNTLKRLTTSSPQRQSAHRGLPVKFPPPAKNMWTQLPSEILGMVVLQSGMNNNCKAVIAMSQVCSKWREGLSQERSMWKYLQIQHVSPTATVTAPLPWVLKHAVGAGNIQATVSLARFYEAACAPLEAMKFWRKAVRGGGQKTKQHQHAEALWYVGWASYKGLHGLQQDAEEAYLNLNRCAKQLLEVLEEQPAALEGEVGKDSKVVVAEMV